MTPTHKLLRELIALPSVNPAFLPPGDPLAGEQRVAEFLAATAASAGLDVELREVLPGRPNLIARLTPSATPRQRVLLAPHLDTVPPHSPQQLQPFAKSGRLFGRGACDTKGSAAAMVSALCKLARGTRRPAHTEIVFAGLVDEENNQLGSRALAASGFNADLAIVGEPTHCRLVTAHKGDLWLELTTRGQAAHGATPHLGRNAVYAMARVLALLERDYAQSLRRRRHRLLGCGTVSVGTIHGGGQPNIVPDRCTISIDRRSLPGETEAGVRRELRTLLRRHRLSVEISSAKGAECPALETDSGLPLVRQFMRVLGQRRPLGVDFFCDAAVLAGGGIPSVVFGPGDIAQAHTADEWVSLDELESAQHRLVEFLSSLA
jgi:acetylornithine deacetylase/succinyl-diaminopimelate desuccinylase-like protein